PLRAGMVANLSDYPWSSHRHNASGEYDRLVHAHPAYLALGSVADERQRASRAFGMQCISPEETEAIRIHLQRQHLHSSDRFRQAIEAQLGRSVGPRKIGRPRKSVDTRQSTETQERLL